MGGGTLEQKYLCRTYQTKESSASQLIENKMEVKVRHKIHEIFLTNVFFPCDNFALTNSSQFVND